MALVANKNTVELRYLETRATTDREQESGDVFDACEHT